MKEKFLEPELEIISMSVEDIITTSGGTLDPDELPDIIVP